MNKLVTLGNRKKLEHQLLHADESDSRCSAAYELGQLGKKRAVHALIRSFKYDVNLKVRMQSAGALGFLKSKRAIAPLINALLSDPVTEIREIAVNAMRFLENDPRIAEALIQSMSNCDEAPFVREMVAEALGSAGPKK